MDPSRHRLRFWALVAAVPLAHVLLTALWHRANEEVVAFPHGALLRGAFALNQDLHGVEVLHANLLYVVSWLFAIPCGPTLVALLASPAALYLCCCLLLGAVGRELAGPRVGVAAAWILGLIPATWSLSRSFSWELAMLALGLIAALGWVRAWERRDLRWTALPALVCVHVMLLRRPPGWYGEDNGDVNFYLGLALCLVGPPLWVVLEAALAGREARSRGEAAWPAVSRGVLTAALGLAPFAVFLVDRRLLPMILEYVFVEAFDDPGRVYAGGPLAALGQRLLFYPTWLALHQANIVTAILGLVGLAHLARAPDRATRFAALWFGVAFVVLCAVDKKGNTYFACALPGLALLLGIGLTRAATRLPRPWLVAIAGVTALALVEQAVVVSFEPAAHPRAWVLPDASGAPARFALLPRWIRRWDAHLRETAERSRAIYGVWSSLPSGVAAPGGLGPLGREMERRLDAGADIPHVFPGHYRSLDSIRDVLGIGALYRAAAIDWRPGLAPIDDPGWIEALRRDDATLVCPLPPDWEDGAAARRDARMTPWAVSARGRCALWGPAP